MTFLEIDFHGLCLFSFVPAEKAVYVLLPRTGPGVHGGVVDEHTLTLTYQPSSPGDPPVTIPLSGGDIVFENVQADTVTGLSIPGLADISRYATTRVRGANYTKKPHQDLFARVKLTAGGPFDAQAKLACWRMTLPSGDHECVEMTNHIYWRMPLVGNTCSWHLEAVDGFGSTPQQPLEPQDDDVVRISIEHVHPGKHADDPDRVRRCGFEPHHFRAFYWLLEGSGNQPLPSLRYDGACTGGCPDCQEDEDHVRAERDDDNALTIYTCMVAGAPPP